MRFVQNYQENLERLHQMAMPNPNLPRRIAYHAIALAAAHESQAWRGLPVMPSSEAPSGSHEWSPADEAFYAALHAEGSVDK